MEDLEKELARSRRIVDETTRVVAEKREEINLLRKQAMVLNDEFLRVSSISPWLICTPQLIHV